MTGYTVHTGSTEKFADGWDQIFGTQAPKEGQPAAASKSRKTTKKSAKKSGSKKKKTK